MKKVVLVIVTVIGLFALLVASSGEAIRYGVEQITEGSNR